jgi:DNA-directed RNA polymerase subunit K/omega
MVGTDSDDLILKAGGRFRFVSLVQRRMRELQRGLEPLVERQGTFLETAIEELNQGKIWLVSGDEADKLNEERVGELPEKSSASEKPAKPGIVPPPKTD